MRAPFQERHFDYVFGPNQDARLASIAPGQSIPDLFLTLEPDAPFILRSRAVRQSVDGGSQAQLLGLKTRWASPELQFHQSDYVPETLQCGPYYGQGGNPMPVKLEIPFPAGGVISVALLNTGTTSITNLTFYWRGVKLFPWGMYPAPSYPSRFGGLTFSFPLLVPSLTIGERRLDQIFTVDQDADYVLRAGQSMCSASEVFILLKDSDKRPYANDFVHIDVLFGSADASRFGTGPGSPGLVYPEIYIPKNHQLFYDVYRAF